MAVVTEHWIVVGAGSAGCVAAARLSEAGGRSVTLVEAGPDLVPSHVPPAIDGMDFLGALGEPGWVHDGLVARRRPGGQPEPYVRGRGVGGSSAVNALIGLRGDPALAARWGWDDVDEAWSRVKVPLEEAADGELGAVDRALLSAAPDAFRAPLTRAGGRRVTAAEAYLWPARARPNLVVRPECVVDCVTLDGRRATGVRLADGDELAGDRVVVAAGSVHSPAILLRSGLDTPGIGEGLQDHPSAPVTLELRDGARQEPGAGLIIGSLLDRHGIQVMPMNRLGSEPDQRRFGLLMVALMTPRGAAGRVTLSPSDPLAHPDVDLGLLDDPADLVGLRAGVRLLLDLLRDDAFREIVAGASIDEHGTPIATLGDDASIDRWLRSTSGSYVHASSSCAMGRVVDGDGGVLGYDGLYVCDASVFPHIPDVNPHLPTMMLAERLTARWSAVAPGQRPA